MSQAQNESGNAQNLRVTRPATGESRTLTKAEGVDLSSVNLDFDTGASLVSREGNDLIFRFDDGSSVAVKDLFVTGGKDLPVFVTSDGLELAGADLLKSLDPNLDISTAMGPQQSPDSGGINDYDPNLDLIGGLDRLGMLGGTADPRGTAIEDNEYVTPVINLSPSFGESSLTIFNEDDLAPDNIWAAGAVLTLGQSVAVDPEGDTLTYSLPVGTETASISINGVSYVIGTYSIDPATGVISLTLSATVPQATLDAVNSMEVGKGYALSPITVNATDGTSVISQTLSPSISGVNDAPELTVTPGAALDEDDFAPGNAWGSNERFTVATSSSTDAEGDQLTYSIDGDDTAKIEIGGVWHDIGKYSVDSNGNVTLELSDSLPQTTLDAINSMGLDASHNAIKYNLNPVTVIVTDVHGATDSETLNLSISGVNDNPEITVENTFTLTENQLAPNDAQAPANTELAVGKVAYTDAENEICTYSIDGSDVAQIQIGGIWLTIGTYAVDSNGNVTLKLDDSMSVTTLEAINSMRADGTYKLNDVVIKVEDPHGGSDKLTFTPNEVQGNNDLAKLTHAGSVVTSENDFVDVGTHAWKAGNEISLGSFTPSDVDNTAAELGLNFVGPDGNAAIVVINGDEYKIGEYKVDQSTGDLIVKLDPTITPVSSGMMTHAEVAEKINEMTTGDTLNLKSVQVQVNDGIADGQTVTLNPSINGVNDAPSGKFQGQSIKESDFVTDGTHAWAGGGTEIYIGDVTATDIEGDSTLFSIKDGTKIATISIEEGGTTNTYTIGEYKIDASGKIVLELDAGVSQTVIDAINGMAQTGGTGTSTGALTGALSKPTVVLTDASDPLVKSEYEVTPWNVTGVNDAPELTADTPVGNLTENDFFDPNSNDPGSVSDGPVKVSSVTGTDIDGDDLVYSINTAGGNNIAYANINGVNTAVGVFTVDQNGDVYLEAYDAFKGLEATPGGYNFSTVVTVTDRHGETDTATVTVNVAGVDNQGRFIGGSTNADEAGNVTAWGDGSKTTAEVEAERGSGSGSFVKIPISFSDAEGDTLTITITEPAPGAESITFTWTHTPGQAPDVGTISFAGGAPTSMTTENGYFTWDASNEEFRYYPLNKTDQLNDGESVSDTFGVTIVDDQGRAGVDGNFTVTVEGENDAPLFYEQNYGTGYGTANPQVLTPYVDGHKAVSGQLGLGDIDTDPETLTFALTDKSTGLPIAGTQISATEWQFDVGHGIVTITWDGSATNAAFPDPGAWQYKYEMDGDYILSNKFGEINDKYTITASDGSLTDSATLNIEASLVTPGLGRPVPVSDVVNISIDPNTNDQTDVLNGTTITNPIDLNVLANDQDCNGDPALTTNQVVINSVDGQAMTASGVSGSNEYGTWKLMPDGTFTFDVDETGAAFIALGKDPAEILIPYVVSDSIGQGPAVNSYVKVVINGNNDAPEGRNLVLNVKAGWGANDNVLDIASLATDPDAGDTLSFTFLKDDGTGTGTLIGVSEVGGNSTSSTFDPDDFALKAGFEFDPYGDLASGQQYEQLVTAADSGASIFNFDYGWLIQNTDGTFEFVVNQNNPDVIALKPGETLPVEIKFEVSDGTATDQGSLTINISGSYDKLATHAIADGAVNKTYFTSVNSDGKAVFSFGAGRGEVDFTDPDWADNLSGTVNIANASSHTGSGHSAQMNLCSLGTNVAQALESGSTKYNFYLNEAQTAASSALYGRDENDDIVRLGTIAITNNTSLTFYPISSVNGTHANWEEIWALKGTYTEFYTDAQGNNELTVWASSNNDKTGTVTPIEVDFVMSFADDSPVVESLRLSVNGGVILDQQLNFHDVDNDQADLRLWVEDENGDVVEVPAGGMTVNYDHGTLTINADGEFSYTQNFGYDSENHNIRVIVDDGNSATEGFITIDNTGVTNAVTVDDKLNIRFGSNNVQTTTSDSLNVLANDSDSDDNSMKDNGAVVLNAGTYVLSDSIILAGDDNTADGLKGGNTGFGASKEVTDSFSLPDGSPFELSLKNFTLTIESNGEVLIHTNPDFSVYYKDPVTGDECKLNLTYATYNAGVKELADRTGLSEQEVKDYLKVTFEYQVQETDPVTGQPGDVVTGNIVYDFGNAFNNGSQYYTEGLRANGQSAYVVSSATNTEDDGTGTRTGFLNSTLKTSNQTILTDLDGDDFYFGAWSLDANGVAIPGSITYSSQTLREITGDTVYTAAQMANATNQAIADEISFEIPVYVWLNTSTGEVSNAKGSGTGWECYQVGVATFVPGAVGTNTGIGYDDDGSVLAKLFHTLNGSLEINLYDTSGTHGDATKQEIFLDYMRDMSETTRQDLLIYQVGSKDTDGLASNTGSGTMQYVSVTGSDVIVSTAAFAINERTILEAARDTDPLNDGQQTDFGSTSKNTWDSSRTNPDGWQDTDPAFTQEVKGAYGQLTWDSSAKTYVYTLYTVGDTNAAGKVLTQPDIDAIHKTIEQMVDGQSITEQFNVTMVDKNNEKSEGTLNVSIKGQDAVWSGADISMAFVEHAANQGSLATEFNITDAGDIVYYIRVNGVDYPASGQEGRDQISIKTEHGTLLFSPKTGIFTFEADGSLKEGHKYELEMEAWAVIHNDAYASGSRTTPEVDLDLTITGVNDAPLVITATQTAAATQDSPLQGGISWIDPDNAATDAVTVHYTSANGNTATDYSGSYTAYDWQVEGDYGNLLYDEETGSFLYEADGNKITASGDHRVVDTFEVSVTDTAHTLPDGSTGTSATGTRDLVFYSVDGEYIKGTGGSEILNANDQGMSDIIWTGGGDDTVNLDGSSGESILVWKFGDEGSASSAALDIINDFTTGTGGDMLDLRNMLDGLIGITGKEYKDLVSYSSDGTDTTIDIKDADNNTVQQIQLNNVDLQGGGTYDELVAQINLLTS